jgi:hypothetical protein
MQVTHETRSLKAKRKATGALEKPSVYIQALTKGKENETAHMSIHSAPNVPTAHASCPKTGRENTRLKRWAREG